MLAVDTNVVVRLLTGDDPRQFARAEALFRDNEVEIANTVLLETEWVLRGAYGYTSSEIVGAVRKLSSLPQVTLPDRTAALRALDLVEQGLDYADAMHIACAAHCEAFVSFDRSCVKRATRLGVSARSP